jgi:hypothetical protein
MVGALDCIAQARWGFGVLGRLIFFFRTRSTTSKSGRRDGGCDNDVFRALPHSGGTRTLLNASALI